MLWYVLSQGQKSGPYDQAELAEMLRTEKISLESYILKKDSIVARKLFCCPEVLFAHFLDESITPTERQHVIKTPQIAPSPDTRITESPSFEPQVKTQQTHKTHAHLQNKHGEPQKNTKVPFSKQTESTSTAARKKRRKMYPPNPENLQPKSMFKKQLPKKVAVPNQMIDKSNKAFAPSHQLPKASSEAVLRNQGDFTWAKNRVNPTAPKTVIHERIHLKRSKGRRKIVSLKNNELKLLGIGLSVIFAVILIVSIVVNKSPRSKQPRFSLKTVAEQSTTPTAVQSDEPQEVVVEKTEKNIQKENPPQNQNIAEKQEKKKPQEKQSRKELARKKNTKNQDSAKLQARNFNKTSVPRNWPKYVAQNGAQLQGGLLKVIAITGIRLLKIPDYCQPCQVPAQLADGTRLLLTSQNSKIWKNVQKQGVIIVQAKGLLIRNSQGYFNVIVQDLEP